MTPEEEVCAVWERLSNPLLDVRPTLVNVDSLGRAGWSIRVIGVSASHPMVDDVHLVDVVEVFLQVFFAFWEIFRLDLFFVSEIGRPQRSMCF